MCITCALFRCLHCRRCIVSLFRCPPIGQIYLPFFWSCYPSIVSIYLPIDLSIYISIHYPPTSYTSHLPSVCHERQAFYFSAWGCEMHKSKDQYVVKGPKRSACLADLMCQMPLVAWQCLSGVLLDRSGLFDENFYLASIAIVAFPIIFCSVLWRMDGIVVEAKKPAFSTHFGRNEHFRLAGSETLPPTSCVKCWSADPDVRSLLRTGSWLRNVTIPWC